jgi:hypothetical protein
MPESVFAPRHNLRKLPPLMVLFAAAGAVLLIIVMVLSVLLWRQSHSGGAGSSADKTKSQVLREVADRFEVPTDETAQVAVIQDAGNLPNQPFYKGAKDGDYVVYYQKAQLFLLYRPSEHKFIHIAPVVSNPQR